MNKREMRRAVRAMYPGQAVRDAESREICRRILNWRVWQEAACVGLYVPMRREADVFPLIGDALAEGKRVVLPRVEGPGVMTLRLIRSVETFVPGSYGIPEPGSEAETVSPAELSLLLVPLEALDGTGMRLGKGGGYYDRLLPELHCPAVGVLLNHQWVTSVPAEPWDAPLDAAVDAEKIHVFTPKPDTDN